LLAYIYLYKTPAGRAADCLGQFRRRRRLSGSYPGAPWGTWITAGPSVGVGT
jgi:hypothetical protein